MPYHLGMPRRTSAEQGHLDAYYESVARAWDAMAPDKRPTYDALRKQLKLTSTAPLWALFNRRRSGRPGQAVVDRLVASIPLDAEAIKKEAAQITEAMQSLPMAFPDGMLPAAIGGVSPVSFIIEYGFSGLRTATRNDLLTAAERLAFPYSPDAKNQVISAPFSVGSEQLVDYWLGRAESKDDKGNVTVRPRIFCSRLSRVQAASRRFEAPKTSILDNWAFRMSPDFVLLRRPHTLSHKSSRSWFGTRAVERRSFDAALEELTKELGGVTLVCAPGGSHRENVIRLMKYLDIELVDDVTNSPLVVASATSNNAPSRLDAASVVRFAVHHLSRGHFADKVVVVGGAPHYWSARSEKETGIEVLLTDHDLYGAAPGFECHQGEADRDLSALRDACSDERLKANQDWLYEDTVLALHDSRLSEHELQLCGRYFRRRFDATKARWNEGSPEYRRDLVGSLLTGYEHWGGVGAQLDFDGMTSFVDYGMNLYWRPNSKSEDYDPDSPAQVETFSSPDAWKTPFSKTSHAVDP